MLGGVEGVIPRQILRCCVVIKALVDKSTEEQLVGMKSLFNNSQRVFKFLFLLNGAERKTQE